MRPPNLGCDGLGPYRVIITHARACNLGGGLRGLWEFDMWGRLGWVISRGSWLAGFGGRGGDRSVPPSLSSFQLLPGFTLSLQHVSHIPHAAAPMQLITMGLTPEHRRSRRTTARAPAGAETDMQYGHQPAMLDEQPRLQHQHGL